MYGWEHRRLSLAATELNWSQKQFNDYVNARPERFSMDTTDKNHSTSVGVFVGFTGDSYGMGVEASGSVGKGKENSHTESWQNNQLHTDKFVTHSAGKLTLDATNLKAEHWKGDVQALDAISRQDVTKYDSHQTQAGGSVSTSGASANAAYNSAKLNTVQVEKQASVEIGKGGMDVKVHNNTHLDGAVITSDASQANNRLETGTLTTSNIQNYSELETRSGSISGGTNGINPMSALSLLGNKNESEQSTTKAAVGKNINITLTKDPNGEMTLQNLNRDTEHANQKVKKHDINEVKETQELVKGIGEIAEKAMQIYTYNEREAVEKAKLEAGKVATRLKNEGKSDKEIAEHPDYTPLKAAWDNKQKRYDKNYGTGSTTKRAVDAVTAALQGLAAKDINQAAVGLASPYLNEQIKKYTQNADGTVNPQANLMAHALLGAVEAAATGNNALAGAAAGAGSEAVAKLITETLYQGKTTEQLTENEKQNVVFLSQLAGGLAAGLIGESTQSAAVGADVGKRAVENNYLFRHEAEELARLSKKRDQCLAQGGDCSSLQARINELGALDRERNNKLDEACRNKMTAECAKELVTLCTAHSSFKDYRSRENYNHLVDAEFQEVSRLHGEMQSQRMENLAKQALMKISVDEPVENAVILTEITVNALKGDETAKEQLRKIGNEIKKAVLSPIDTLSENTRAELKQADELEAAGYRDEADLIRMKVYLSNELTAISTLSGIAGLAHSGIKNVGKLALKEGALSNKVVNIEWGKGIQKQGKAWEEYLQTTSLPEGTLNLNEIKPNFKTFDHLLPDGTAVSAKTMDTVGSKTYQDPKRITHQLNKYVDDMVNFTEDGKQNSIRITSEQIKNREIYLAIPYGSNKEQLKAINRSTEYARSKGVNIIVKEIK
nr:VENN motif pre-toxin domain-containing protein [Mannheimia massilioguelmaensis]